MLGSCALSRAVVEQCLADGTVRPLTWNPRIPADAVARLARHPEAEIRELAAARPDLGPDLVAELREDPDEDVRMRARLHPFPRTWAEYRAIDAVIGHGPDCTCPFTGPAPRPLPERRRLAVGRSPRDDAPSSVKISRTTQPGYAR
ncbi:hypothetical protein ACQKM2_20500 [Streptomyces sp. NPDC004126]|uniref:hypothetical protein n=1 Tax=Streptomyces sp. NPDC004126 TaxID=3390695 RepID=UPI003D008E17